MMSGPREGKPAFGSRKEGGSRFGGKKPAGRFPKKDMDGGFSSRAPRKKMNRFYSVFTDRSGFVDYKETEKLAKFLTEKGKIIPRRITGLTAKQQRSLCAAVKRARHTGLLPFQAD